MVDTILVPIDIHEDSSWRRVLPRAVQLARLSDATLHVLTVVEHVEIDLPDLPSPQEISRRRSEGAEQKLERIVANYLPADMPHVAHATVGNVHREILRLAQEIDADLIIMASHRPALRTYLLGAHAARVVRHAPCSVYVVRHKDR